VRSALERPLAAARACVRTTTPVRISVDLTFVSSGDMSAGGVHGARGAPARCIEHSLRPARVGRFTNPSFTISISVIGR
jgi:hypothetical protein